MVSQTIKIINKMGFHMRPAKDFVNAMSNYSSDVTIIAKNQKIDGKSVMSIMAAGIKQNTDVTVECDGSDEGSALKAAVDMINSGFGEDD